MYRVMPSGSTTYCQCHRRHHHQRGGGSFSQILVFCSSLSFVRIVTQKRKERSPDALDVLQLVKPGRFHNAARSSRYRLEEKAMFTTHTHSDSTSFRQCKH